MAAFDEIITPAINMASRLVSAQLKRQAPVKTGALKRSIHVRAVMDEDSVKFVTDYLYYGVFTDLGTGRYRSTTRKSWNPKPGKGKGGIIPRYWTSLQPDVMKQAKGILAKAIGQYIKISIQRVKL